MVKSVTLVQRTLHSY